MSESFSGAGYLPLTVGLDFGGVFCNKQNAKSVIVSDILGIPLSPAQCRGSFIREQYSHLPHMIDRYRLVSERVMEQPDFIELATPIPGVFDNVEKLLNSGRIVLCVSSENPSHAPIVNDWFKHWYHPIPLVECVFTNHKPKGEPCSKHHIGAFVDDEMDKLSLTGVPLKYHVDMYNPLASRWTNEHGQLLAGRILRDLDSLEANIRRDRAA